MKLYIKDANVYEGFEDEIYIIQIIGQLENGLTIKIEEHNFLELYDYVGKTIECLLFVNYICALDEYTGKKKIQEYVEGKKISTSVLRGKIFRGYRIPEKWLKFCMDPNKIKYLKEDFDAIKTEDYYFPISDREHFLIDKKEDSYIKIGLSIQLWYPLD